MLRARFKKIMAFLIATCVFSCVCILPLRADPISDVLGYLAGIINIQQYLQDIDESTTAAPPFSSFNLWNNTNSSKNYLYAILVELNAWLLQDTSQSTAELQTSLTSVTNAITQDQANLLSLQQQLTSDFFGSAITTTRLPNANDLSYETLLGQPYFSPDPRNNPQSGTKVNSPYNYLKNASGSTITHPLPSPSWNGSATDITNYMNYYNTISAVQTFNAYVLSQMYNESTNGAPLTQAQNNLLSQASGSNWFSTVASENIGFVLRQILMFGSQTYVLMTQLLKTQNELLETQAMTNSLLVLLNQSTEQSLASKASGATPTN